MRECACPCEGESRQEHEPREHEAVQSVRRLGELVGRLGEREDEQPCGRDGEADAAAGLGKAAAREPVLADPLLRRRREPIERAAVEDGDDGECGERVAAGVVEREPELEPDPGREDEDGRGGDRARADDERGRRGAARPEQEGQRVVRLDVVHLPDEEQGGAEEEDAEQIERLADPRPAARALAQVVGGRVRACDGRREQDEPDAVAHPVPVGGDEADHAEPDRDRADHGERRRRAAAPFLPGAGISAADRLRLLGRDEPFGDPRLGLAAQVPGERAVRHLLRCRGLGQGAVGDVDERRARLAVVLGPGSRA